jgi:hypothetical protein
VRDQDHGNDDEDRDGETPPVSARHSLTPRWPQAKPSSHTCARISVSRFRCW